MDGGARRLVVVAGFILTFAVLHMFDTVGLLHSQIIEGIRGPSRTSNTGLETQITVLEMQHSQNPEDEMVELRNTTTDVAKEASPTESPTTSPTANPTASPTVSPTASPTVLFPTPSKKETSCALLFFGLVKHFEIVLPSIQEYILESNKDCDIYAHTYNIERTTNPRNNERDEKITPDRVYQLTESVVMDTDDAFHASHDVKYYRAYFPKNRGWQFPESMDNMVKQWHSIARVWELMESNELTLGVTYSRVGLFRLDVQFKNNIYMNDGDAVEPKGMNDRLFYGTRSNAEVWATGRFDQVQTYVTTHNNKLWSEGFMKWLMRDIAVESRSICFYRVRANGKISTSDCKLPKAASPTTSPTSNVVEDDEQDLV